MTSARRALAQVVPGARRVLDENWTGSSTVPSRSLYPHQWSWDSAFIAIGSAPSVRPAAPSGSWRPCSAAQWADGRIPHIVFNPAVPPGAYFPGPDFWRPSAGAHRRPARRRDLRDRPAAGARARRLAGAPRPTRRASVRSRLPAPAYYPRLAAWHRYLADRRDLGGGGLVSRGPPVGAGHGQQPLLGRARWPASSPSRRRRSAAPTSTTARPPTARRTWTTGGTCASPPTTADRTGYRDGGHRTGYGRARRARLRGRGPGRQRAADRLRTRPGRDRAEPRRGPRARTAPAPPG